MTTKQNDYLATADELGARLCRDAVWWQSRCNWMGAAMEVLNGTWTVVERALGPDLYGGTSGVALFLARLYQSTGEKLYRTVALGAMNQAWSKLEDIAPVAQAGFYSGWLGVAFARLVVAESVGDQGEFEPTLKRLESLARREIQPQALDVISGCAGAVPVLLELYRKSGDDWLIDSAIRQGEHMLNMARKRDEGWSWRTLEIPMQDDLTGFSHGVAGIAWALLELYAVTGEQRWRDAAEQGFRYERRWFSSTQGNWADLRTFDKTTSNSGGSLPCSMAWCHGAPGIGLSRLRAWEVLRDDVYREEAKAASDTIANLLEGRGSLGLGSFSLCHGQAGNAETLLFASQLLDTSYGRAVECTADRGIEVYRSARASWPCGVNGGGETPNLLLGLAGIGYFYLRASNPEEVPSVLMVGESSLSR